MPETSAINRAVLDDLLATTGGDPTFLGELIDTYLEDSATLLPGMRQALASGSAEQLRRAAHTLRSNSLSLGAEDLAAVCRDLEEQGRVGALSGAGEQLARVEAEYEPVRRE